MLARKLLRISCRAGRGHLGVSTTVLAEGTSSTLPPPTTSPPLPPLPYYPLDVALERKKIINDAVLKTPVGKTPNIPPRGYLEEEHRMWEALYCRVLRTAHEHACREFVDALVRGAAFTSDRIPDIGLFSQRLYERTGWQVAPVAGSTPPGTFFAHLEQRQMPCTQYIRPHTKFAFTEDPDCTHEMLGHLPALFIPSWARLSQCFGATAGRLAREGKEEELEQLIVMYFALVEKGLVKQDGSIKAIGASVISGSGELVHAMENPQKHLPFESDLVMEFGSTDETDFMKHFFVGENIDDMADKAERWMRDL